MSRFDHDETQVCAVNWPQTFKDEMVTSCDHMDVVPAGHRKRSKYMSTVRIKEFCLIIISYYHL